MNRSCSHWHEMHWSIVGSSLRSGLIIKFRVENALSLTIEILRLSSHKRNLWKNKRFYIWHFTKFLIPYIFNNTFFSLQFINFRLSTNTELLEWQAEWLVGWCFHWTHVVIFGELFKISWCECETCGTNNFLSSLSFKAINYPRRKVSSSLVLSRHSVSKLSLQRNCLIHQMSKTRKSFELVYTKDKFKSHKILFTLQPIPPNFLVPFQQNMYAYGQIDIFRKRSQILTKLTRFRVEHFRKLTRRYIFQKYHPGNRCLWKTDRLMPGHSKLKAHCYGN